MGTADPFGDRQDANVFLKLGLEVTGAEELKPIAISVGPGFLYLFGHFERAALGAEGVDVPLNMDRDRDATNYLRERLVDPADECSAGLAASAT
jgi:hypothetical protein